MSLVDYASDDDEDMPDLSAREASGTENGRPVRDGSSPSASSTPQNILQSSPMSSNPHNAGFQSSAQVQTSTTWPVRLPDAAELLRGMEPGPSTSSGDHTSRVAAAVATSRKRPQLNGAAHPSHHTKVPRGNPHLPPRRLPDTVGGLLVPPQVRGRSNVATEDLDKLFVHRQQKRPD